MEMLIKGGARLDIKDNVNLPLPPEAFYHNNIIIMLFPQNGLTAFEVAKAHDQQAICDLLENYTSKKMRDEIVQVCYSTSLYT